MATGSMSYAAPGDDGVALAAAEDAKAAAENARQMVLRRDPKLDTAAEEAATAAGNYAAILQLSKDYQAALKTSVDDRAAIHLALEGLAKRVVALEEHQSAHAWQATPALALLQVRDYTLTLSRRMPSATYTAKPWVDPAVAGKLGAVVTAQTDTTVTVRVTALLAVGAGGFGITAWT